MGTIYKDIQEGTYYLIARKATKNRTEYLTGSFNPTIDITYNPDGAKLYDTRDAAQKELDELELTSIGFVVEEHIWVDNQLNQKP